MSGRTAYLYFNGAVGVLGVAFNVTTIFFKFKPMAHDMSEVDKGTEIE